MNGFSGIKHALKIVQLSIFVCMLQACGATSSDTGSNATSNSTSSDASNSTQNASATSNRKSDEVSVTDTSEASNEESRLPQRIALLPFNQQADTNAEIADMLRESVFSHLSSTNYLFVRPQEVDQRILLLENQTQFSPADAPLLSGLLESDAILIGDIISSDATYVGVAAQIYYKVQISLVDKTGKVIWTDVFSERSIEGGVSADPFSMLYSLAVTAMHLGKENLFAVADKIGRQVSTSIPQPEGAFTLNNLYIENVVHDAVNKTLKYGDSIKVGIKAPPNMAVTVSIENISELFNATETQAGTYFTDIPVSSNWNGTNLLLTAYVIDKTGNRSRKISTLGLINIDNTAPAPVRNLRVDLAATSLDLTWEHDERNIEYVVYQLAGNEVKNLGSTNSKKFSVDGLTHNAFENYRFAVEAKDPANNISDKAIVEDEYLPSKALKQSNMLTKAKLPLLISQDTRLVKQHSPYLVDNNTQVSNGATLYIEPGVQLEFSQSGSIEVLGSLNTFGQAPIIFSALSSKMGDQTFIKINSNKHVLLNGFVINNAGIAIEVLKGKPTIQNCEIMNSKYTALSIVNTANVKVNNCIINGSNTSAIVVANNARLSIKNSQLSNNLPFHIQNSSTYSVDARNNQWQPAPDVMTVLGNVKY
ncbi:MAG: right-handed parallel beta-helix repeat-containing protein [Glaciecola sp.]